MSEATQDQSLTPAESVVEVPAFRNRPPVAVRLDRAAPFGWWAALVIALVTILIVVYAV